MFELCQQPVKMNKVNSLETALFCRNPEFNANHQKVTSSFSAVIGRNGTAWRRSLASGGFRSAKAAPRKAPGREPAA